MATLLTRPVPQHRLPAAAGAAVVVLALPIFAVAGWPLAGWALGAVLWVGTQLLELLFRRVGIAGSPSLRGSGVVAFGMMARGILVMLVAFAVALSRPSVAVAGALLYAVAYTLELGFLLASFAAGGQRR